MKLSDFLSPERVLAKIESTTKKEALQEIAQFICETEPRCFPYRQTTLQRHYGPRTRLNWDRGWSRYSPRA